MTNIELLGSHVTNIEHFSRDAFQECRVTRQTSTVLCFVFIGTTPSADFVNASGLYGDAKQLCLPRFDGFGA